MKQRLLIIFALLIVAALIFEVLQSIKARVHPVLQTATTTEVVHCSNDAKLCPDGTTVLRTGTQCEFAVCPSIYGDVSQWRARKDDVSGVTFKYPETFGSQYVTGNDWPPKFSVGKEPFSCEESVAATSSPNKVHQEMFNNTQYCIAEQVGTVSGGTDTKYHILFSKNSKTVEMIFALQRVQCLKYQGTEQSACQATQASFKILELVDAIVGTVGF